ncbi:rhotekin isoform X3 [Anguilla anguilla]|uniref:rhotekin isoform X3 n=1 Tax=Anguilla anguilla TaxID=7936 RepID=UPI0015B0E727|nr:rhotekin isoform X3 [Anguilla anguilla]
MFCRNQTTRATVARGSAMEMEIRRGKFRRSIFFDTLQDSDIQKKIDYEIRMRDGACKLLAACSQRDQALEAAKSLLTCNARIMAYMSELQRMKEAQVMQRVARRSSDAGPMDDRLPCKAKVAISDLRIPLMWKDTEYFKNKGELHRCAVFCLLHLGGEIYDTDMVVVDRTLTDICFDNTIVFEAGPGFELKVELYSCCTEDEFSGGSTPRKLASKLSSSLGRSSGKKVRAALEPGGGSPVTNGGGATLLLPVPSVPGPKYHLLAHASLTLTHVQDSFRTHDLSISGNEECSYWLPLYGSMCCRLAAQPHCMTQEMMCGYLKVKQLGGEPQGWKKIYGVLKGTNLFCYHRQEDVEAKVEPVCTIAINKETRIRSSEKERHSKAQSISISNQYGGEDVTHTLSADSKEDTQRWMEAFWQQFYDMSQWKQCCDDLMKIDMPLPRKPAIVMAKQGSLYHEMVIDTSDDISTVTDILTQRMQEFELRSRLGSTPPWMALFEESPNRHHHHRPPRAHCRTPHSPLSPRLGLLSSDASLTSESDSPCSASPCSRRGWGDTPSRFRPRTLSLDAKLTGLRGRRYGGLPCACQAPPSVSASVSASPASTSSSSSSRPPQKGLSCSSSTSSNSSSEGSSTPESDGSPFSRPSPARRSMRNLRAKLDPRNWLQSQV